MMNLTGFEETSTLAHCVYETIFQQKHCLAAKQFISTMIVWKRTEDKKRTPPYQPYAIKEEIKEADHDQTRCQNQLIEWCSSHLRLPTPAERFWVSSHGTSQNKLLQFKIQKGVSFDLKNYIYEGLAEFGGEQADNDSSVVTLRFTKQYHDSTYNDSNCREGVDISIHIVRKLICKTHQSELESSDVFVSSLIYKRHAHVGARELPKANMPRLLGKGAEADEEMKFPRRVGLKKRLGKEEVVTWLGWRRASLREWE